jgi:ubiquinone/menaquinone biosynthesis C-methylase UbiE
LETLAWLRARGVEPKTALDLCCGTGAATLALAEHGIEVTGIDRSAEMLHQARDNAHRAGRSVPFVQGDVRELACEAPVDLCTCFYDSLNYLVTEAELFAVFTRVRACLHEEGWFVFDLNTNQKLTDWVGTFLAADESDLFLVYETSYDPTTTTSPLRVIGFAARTDGTWDRFEEEHVERAYPLETVAGGLEEVGFRTVFAYAFFDRPPHLGPPAAPEHRRWIFFVSPRRG